MSEIKYRFQLDEDAEVIAELLTERGQADRYSVVLLARDRGDWKTVRVYDNDRGTPHMHRYSRNGVKGAETPTGDETSSDGYNMALDRVHKGFREMINGWKH